MKKIALVLALVLSVSVLGGCQKKETVSDGKIHITVSDFPQNSNPEAQASQQKVFDEFMKANPDVVIEGDQYAYAIDTFLPLVNSGTVPTLYRSWYTEIDKIIDSGYAADITEQAKKYGYDTMFTDEMIGMTTKNGKIYGIPSQVYAMGLTINKKLFEQAGLVDENGVPIAPKTWDELRQTAITIKEKTGKAGFTLPTSQNYGGWCFTNLAWSYGVKFMEERDGKLYATFNSPEMETALKFYRDLKWVDGVLPENAFLNAVNVQELTATDGVAMTIEAGVPNSMFITYGMSKDDVAKDVNPAGPAGRYALMGGEVYFIKPDATPEEIDACLRYLKHIGITDEITPEYEAQLRDKLQLKADKGEPILPTNVNYPLYKQEGERQKRIDAVYADFLNVDAKLFNTTAEDLIVRPEERYKTQELYKTIDGLLQEVLTNEKADIPALLAQAEADFQHNYLDNYELK